MQLDKFRSWKLSFLKFSSFEAKLFVFFKLFLLGKKGAFCRAYWNWYHMWHTWVYFHRKAAHCSTSVIASVQNNLIFWIPHANKAFYFPQSFPLQQHQLFCSNQLCFYPISSPFFFGWILSRVTSTFQWTLPLDWLNSKTKAGKTHLNLSWKFAETQNANKKLGKHFRFGCEKACGFWLAYGKWW